MFVGVQQSHFCKEYLVRIADFEGVFCLGNEEIRVPSDTRATCERTLVLFAAMESE